MGDGKTDVAKSMELTLDDWTNPPHWPAEKTGSCSTSSHRQKQDASEAEGRANNDLVWNLVIYLRSFSRRSLWLPRATQSNERTTANGRKPG